MRVRVIHADCRVALRELADASIDACVTDPPYSLVSINRRLGNATPEDAERNFAARKTDGQGCSPYRYAARGFMGKTWDTGATAFDPAFWAEVLRALKPGAHLLAMGGTRTFHRLVCAIEDAGFEIRDTIAFLHAQGFPKSHDVSKAIDRKLGAEGARVATGAAVKRMIPGADQNKAGWEKNNGREFTPHAYAPATEQAAQWQGWGTALKPAMELVCLARKPLIGTVAQNVLTHGTGALNVDACRIGYENDAPNPATNPLHRLTGGYKHAGNDDSGSHSYSVKGRGEPSTANAQGRWPANVLHDGSEEVLRGFPEDAGAFAPVRGTEPSTPTKNVYGEFSRGGGAFYGDSGSAARFFYTAKADAGDRLGSKHPTVKPVDLMAYLCRLVTPPGGVVLDPFAGSGTTGMACMREGFRAILIEREAEYVADIKRRLAHVRGEDTPLFTEVRE